MASSSSLSLLFLLFPHWHTDDIGQYSLCRCSWTPYAMPLSSFTEPIGEKPSELCGDGAQMAEAGTGTLLEKEVVCNCLKEMMEEHPMVTPEKAHNVASVRRRASIP